MAFIEDASAVVRINGRGGFVDVVTSWDRQLHPGGGVSGASSASTPADRAAGPAAGADPAAAAAGPARDGAGFDCGLRRIAEIYAIEKDIRGTSPGQRLSARQARSAPLVAAFGEWLQAQRLRISARTVSIPFLSMMRMPLEETRSLTKRFSDSTQKRWVCRFGKKRRRVLRWE